MPIIVNLDVMLARRKMRLNDLSERVGITPQNLSVLKTGRARAVRLSTLENCAKCWPVSPVTCWRTSTVPPAPRPTTRQRSTQGSLPRNNR